MIEQFIRAVHWRANKRSSEPDPEVDPALLTRARKLHADGAYEKAIAVVEGQAYWRSDPRAWRLLGLCRDGLARYADAGVPQNELYDQVDEAYRKEVALRETEIAKAEVNWAASRISRHQYDEAMALALRARERDPNLVTSHIAILAIHNRRDAQEALAGYVGWLLKEAPRVFDHEVFKAHLSSDPDLAGVGDVIAKQKEKAV